MSTVPKGYRFHPSDEELLSDLELKNQCKDSQFTLIIPEIDVCKYEPRQLPELAVKRTQNLVSKFFLVFFWFIKDDYSWGSQGKWYFFTPRDYKYKNSRRSNRTTGEGFYKITGKDRPIKAPGSNVVIGKKRTLTFYQRGGPKPQRTGWVIHEYYLIQERSDPPMQIGDFVICCLKYKSDNSDHVCNQGSSSNSLASNVLSQDEENWVSQELVNVVPVSKGNHYEAENGGSCSDVENQAEENGNDDQILNGKNDEGEAGGGVITEEEEYRAYQELEAALQVPIGNPHEFKGIQTDPCHTDQTNRPNFVQGQSDRSNSSDMVEELLDNPENLDSLFHPPAPPQLHQLQPLQESPMYTTNVLDCRKRAYPFEYNDPSLLKKNNISTNADDIHVSNSASSENQAANVIPKEFSQQGSDFDSFPANEYGYAQTSINGGPRDISNDNNSIALDDLLLLCKDIDISPVEFSDTDIDGGRGVTYDGNTKGVHESVSEAARALYCCLSAPEILKPSPGSRYQFEAGSNSKDSFVFQDASTFNP